MKDVYNNVFNLITKYQIEDSNSFLEVLTFQLKIAKYQLNFLQLNKPYWFQKKELEEYNEKKVELENRISKFKKMISDEYMIIAKLSE